MSCSAARACDRLGRRDRAARRRGARRTVRRARAADPCGRGSQRRRDRLAAPRRQAHALGRVTSQTARAADRAGPSPARARSAPRRGVRRDRLLRPLVGLQLPRPQPRQLCWSHLLRDFTAHADGMAAQKEFGQAGLRIADQLFAAWQIYKQDGDRRASNAGSPRSSVSCARCSRPRDQTRPQPLHPHHQQQPAQALARALDLRRHRRRRADQQPRRTRPPRRRHLPQALTRQPVRPRRTHHRTAPLRLDHLPPPETLALRLPHPRPQRQRPRRPDPGTRLNQRLNAYAFCFQVRRRDQDRSRFVVGVSGECRGVEGARVAEVS